MMQPTRVLPSNAPPLREADHARNAPRVLQEHSGNRQQSEFGFLNEVEEKYPSSALIENNYPRHHYQSQPQQTQHLFHPQPQHRQAWRYPFTRGGHHRPGPEVEARIQVDAERLYNRIRMSDQYNKYRDRQSKDDKGNGDQKWPDHLERAFFRALIKYPPMGRRKSFHKDKQRGRNELIADCIEELTGESRTRKQVSSHIQVLKPFVENDPLIMKWLSKDDMGAQPGRGHLHSSAYGGGRRASNYPVTSLPQAARTTMTTFPRPDAYSLQNAKGNLDVFEPVDFQVFVQRKFVGAKGHDHEVQRLHTYTQSVPDPLGPELQMNDWPTINCDFPLLGALCAQRPLDCNILVAEASLAFPVETWKEKDGSPLPGVELGISFLCSTRHLALMSKETGGYIVCNNSFYENGVLSKEHSGPSEVKFEPSYASNAACTAGVDNFETQIKFGSKFWAKTLGRLAMRLLDTSRDHKEDVASYIRSITALQEVVVSTDPGHERILVIHWTFRQSSSTCGRASWRKLLLPPSQTSQHVPMMKGERSDSAFDGATPYADSTVSQYQQQQPVPALQSPFEYESSSGSALSSATWPTSISNASVFDHHNIPDWSADNSFDFNAGNINLAYDPNLNFDNFDSSAFNFDTLTDDFAADPVLQEYSQQWCDGQANGFEGQHILPESAGYSAQPVLDSHGAIFEPEYTGHYEQHTYEVTHDRQAYGGAGQELIKEEDALAALADASYMASALGQKQAAVY